MTVRFLDEPRTILDCYLYICGASEIPASYNLWCGISLIASAVEDRVWINKFGPLYPNLYVGLLGPSANGKNEAMKIAMKIMKQHPKIGLFYGRATAQFLLSHMSKNRTDDAGKTHRNRALVMVMPELSMCLPKGDGADTFIKQVTDMFSGDTEIPLMEGTITRSLNAMHDGWCLNWLFGSNLAWLLDVIPATAISGGTFGRIIGVHENYLWGERYEMPVFPTDRDEVLSHLHRRIDEIGEITGEVTRTASAKSVMTRWYKEREKPDDDAIVPAWKRQQDIVFKLSMILSLSESTDLVVTDSHAWKAMKLSESIIRKLGDLQAAAATSRDTAGIAYVRQLMRGVRRPMGRTEILKRVISKGIGGAQQLTEIMQTLTESGEVAERGLGRAKIYSYMARRKMPLVTMPKPEEDE